MRPMNRYMWIRAHRQIVWQYIGVYVDFLLSFHSPAVQCAIWDNSTWYRKKHTQICMAFERYFHIYMKAMRQPCAPFNCICTASFEPQNSTVSTKIIRLFIEIDKLVENGKSRKRLSAAIYCYFLCERWKGVLQLVDSFI